MVHNKGRECHQVSWWHMFRVPGTMGVTTQRLCSGKGHRVRCWCWNWVTNTGRFLNNDQQQGSNRKCISFYPNPVHIVSLVCWTLWRGKESASVDWVEGPNFYQKAVCHHLVLPSALNLRVPQPITVQYGGAGDGRQPFVTWPHASSALCKYDSRTDVPGNVDNWLHGSGRCSHHDRAAEGSVPFSERSVRACIGVILNLWVATP